MGMQIDGRHAQNPKAPLFGGRERPQFVIRSQGSASGSTMTAMKPPSRRTSTVTPSRLSAMMHAQMTLATPPLPASLLSTVPTQKANRIQEILTFSGVANELGLNAPSANNGQMRNQIRVRVLLPLTNNTAATSPGTLSPLHPLALARRGQTQGRGNRILSTSRSDSEDDWTDEETGSFVSDEVSIGTVLTVTPPPLPASVPAPVAVPANKQPRQTAFSRDDEEDGDDYEDVTSTCTDEEDEERIHVVKNNNQPHVPAATPRRDKRTRKVRTVTNGGSLRKEKEKDKEREKDKDVKVSLPRNLLTRQLANHRRHHQRPAARIPPGSNQQQQNQESPPALQLPQPRTGKRGGGRSQVQQPAPSVASAALEAQRQREMFQKRPTGSYSGNLGTSPSLLYLLTLLSDRIGPQRLGLLSQLINPDLQIFPAEDSYRPGYSSGDVGSSRVLPRIGVIRGLCITRGSVKLPTKSLAAQPVSRFINATSVVSVRSNGSASSKIHLQVTLLPGVSHLAPVVQRHVHPLIGRMDNGDAMQVRQPPPGLNGKRYQPKGRPQDVEMEDTSSDQSDDDPEYAITDRIQLSKSVAQEKLKVLAERKGIVPKLGPVKPQELVVEQGNNGEANQLEDLPPRLRKEIQQQQSGDDSTTHSNQHSALTQPASQLLQVALVQLVYPYNLPGHAEPSSPWTTRQLMLRTELTESLRHNLLWTRQLQKNEVIGPRRSSGAIASTHGFRPEPNNRNSDILKPVVKLTPKKPDRQSSEGETFDLLGGSSQEETRRLVLMKNKSFAGLYHNPNW